MMGSIPLEKGQSGGGQSSLSACGSGYAGRAPSSVGEEDFVSNGVDDEGEEDMSRRREEEARRIIMGQMRWSVDEGLSQRGEEEMNQGNERERDEEGGNVISGGGSSWADSSFAADMFAGSLAIERLLFSLLSHLLQTCT